jgi:hypothetical protein
MQEPIIADFFEGLYFFQGLTYRVLKKDQSTFAHSLMQRFRRYLERRSQLQHLYRQWRERR